MKSVMLYLGLITGISAFPSDPVVMNTDSGLRYSYLADDSGAPHLVDHWVKVSDLEEAAKYNPDLSNAYHLFTRENSSISQILVLHDPYSILTSNYDANRQTVIIMHGFVGSVTSAINTVLVPTYLAAADLNVIVLDWSAGSFWGPFATQAGQAAGRFINWLNSVAGSSPSQWTVVGFSVGGHGAGHVARSVDGEIAYVISLDPADRWDPNLLFRPNDGAYTEVIHTSALGERVPLGQVDFYPNGGRSNPGCLTPMCNHMRSYYYLSESISRGGFTGTRCRSAEEAYNRTCNEPGSLRMGGLDPKPENSGIFYLDTNFRQPFSLG